MEEVLDKLNIDQCSIMAHSAGAPYALAFANKFPERIRGDVCLLAPWVGGGEGGANHVLILYDAADDFFQPDTSGCDTSRTAS